MKTESDEQEHDVRLNILASLLYRAKKLKHQMRNAAQTLDKIYSRIDPDTIHYPLDNTVISPYENQIFILEEFCSSMKGIRDNYTTFNETLYAQLNTSIGKLERYRNERYGDIIDLMRLSYPTLMVNLDSSLTTSSKLKSPDELKKGKTPKELREDIIRDIEIAMDTLLNAYRHIIRICV